jgi:hypothetical protein
VNRLASYWKIYAKSDNNQNQKNPIHEK